MFQYLFLTSVHQNPRILEKDLQDDELRLPSQANIVRHNISYNFVFGSNCLSFIILKIFAFLLFWPLFCPYLRIHWTNFAHLKDNIVGNKISYNVGQHLFFCICHISRDFLKKPLRHLNLTPFWPLFCQYLRIQSADFAQLRTKPHILKSKSFKNINQQVGPVR